MEDQEDGPAVDVEISVRVTVADMAALRHAGEAARRSIGFASIPKPTAADYVHWLVSATWPNLTGTEWQQNSAEIQGATAQAEPVAA